MLLEFKVKNYKSFVDEAVFSMMAAPKQKGLDYSLFKVKLNKKNIKGLSSSVIYGPNAAGKTNIIGAMDTLRSIVLRGNIRNANEVGSPNVASETLELIPNKTLRETKPVEFRIMFLEAGLFFRYELSIALGTFLDGTYERKVLEEKLSINDKEIFIRSDDLFVNNLDFIRDFISESVYVNEGIRQIAANSLNPTELFLSNGFKLLYSQALAKMIVGWFANKFMVIYRADAMQLIRRFSNPEKPNLYVEKTTNGAAKIFGINSNAVGYRITENDGSNAKLCSIFKDDKNKRIATVAAEMFESYGTIRFITMFPLVMQAIETGGTLVVDEFDASIHPMALMNIINIFHNDDINIHHAQLIFNTHNPIFLNSNLFRRDEIKFVERDDNTSLSTLYALSDFGTAGELGVRKGDDYMQHYFVSEYGAIKDIDFTPLFEELLNLDSDSEVR